MGVLGKITSKGQTTLPAEIRERLGVGPGDSVEYIVGDNGQVVLRKAPTLESLRGLLKVDGPIDWDEIDRLIAERRGRG